MIFSTRGSCFIPTHNLEAVILGAITTRHNFTISRERIYTGIYKIRPATKLPITTVLLNFVKATKGISSSVRYTGTAGSKNGVAGTGWIGGIVGALENATIDNAEVHCSIQNGESKNYGFITGVARSTTNCKIGGEVLTNYDEENDSYDKVKISASNFHNYIYGSGKNTDWTGTDNYDGCDYLSVKPTF